MGHEIVHALDGVDLTVEEGEFLGVMGPSGSGKSSLMNILGCLDNPTSGRYFLAGQDVSRLSERERARVRNREIGFVFQSFNLLPRADALENVELPLILKGIAQEKRAERVTFLLDAVGLSHRTDHRPDQLSGGEQQRVAIARALAPEPLVVLADEPTANLDPAAVRSVEELIGAISAAGTKILMTTHDIAQARRLAADVMFLH